MHYDYLIVGAGLFGATFARQAMDAGKSVLVVEKRNYTMSSLRPIQVGELHGIQNVLMHAGIYLLVSLSLIPQLVVIYTSFLKTRGAIFVDGYSLDSYRTIFSSLGSAIQNTYMFSTGAIIMIVFLGMTVAYLTTRRKSWLTEVIDTLTMFPYIIPDIIKIVLAMLLSKKLAAVLRLT